MDDKKLSRLEDFRQLKKEIRGSKDHLIVGIDIAKEAGHASHLPFEQRGIRGQALV
jgi:hypothetical protein